MSEENVFDNIQGVTYHFSKEGLLEDWREEALRHREEISQLKNQLQQKENIIKEVREIFKDYGDKEDIVGYTMYNITGEMLIALLEILDKENK